VIDGVVIRTAVFLMYLTLFLVLFSALASFPHFRSCLMPSPQILASYPQFGLCLIHLPDAFISDCSSYRHFGPQHMLLVQILPFPSFTSCLVFSLPILRHALLLNITTCPFEYHHMPLMLSFKISPHTHLSYLVILPPSGLVTFTPLRSRNML